MLLANGLLYEGQWEENNLVNKGIIYKGKNII